MPHHITQQPTTTPRKLLCVAQRFVAWGPVEPIKEKEAAVNDSTQGAGWWPSLGS
jgi:hypothetical protein